MPEGLATPRRALALGDTNSQRDSPLITSWRSWARGRGGRRRKAPLYDVPAVRVVALLRVTTAVVLASIGSFLPGISGDRAALFIVVGLVWLPWAAVMLFAADRRGSQLARYGGPVGDLLMLFATQRLAPGAGEAVLIGCLVLVAFALYVAGWLFAALLGAGVIAVTLTSQTSIGSAGRFGTAPLIAFGLAVLALVILFDRAATLQARSAARYDRLRSKADSILANVADGVVVTDWAGHLRQCNPAALRVIGQPQESVIGLSCSSALGLHLGERPLDCSTGCALLSPGSGANSALGIELWRADSNGRRQPLLANATAVPSAEGEVEVVHSLRDVTRLKQAEEAKTMFLATASHELKTPLTVISGFAETLVRYHDLDTATKAAALDAILVRVHELGRIVDRLLLSSRIEAGEVKVVLEEVAPAPIIQARSAALAAATSREISCHVDADLPAAVGNAEALITVIDHLLDNALKYSPGGGPVVVAVTSDVNNVCIGVSDDGIGMDPEQAAHCFDKFWQAESTDVRRFGGTGIGLYIVRSLVEAIGGSIEVDSAKGCGTTFLVRLARPLASPSATDRGSGEASSIREFMRQIGVPEKARL